MDKVVELVGGGSVINEPYLVKFSLYDHKTNLMNKTFHLSTIGCVYLKHILQKPCSTTTMAVCAIYEATAKKLEFASGKSRLATLF